MVWYPAVGGRPVVGPRLLVLPDGVVGSLVRPCRLVRVRGREGGVLRPHRTRQRQRPLLDAHHRPPRQRRLGTQRHQNVDHQRRHCLTRRDRARTSEGIRGFLVPRGTPGLSTRDVGHKLSVRASSTSELVLEDCRVPDSAMLPEAHGIRAAPSCLDEARFGILWGVTGAVRACYEAALDYPAPLGHVAHRTQQPSLTRKVGWPYSRASSPCS